MISSHLSCGFLISYPGKWLGLARCGRLPEACSWANPLCSSDGVRPFGGNARTCRNGYAPPVGLFVVETPFYVRDVAGLIPCLQKKCRTLSRNLRQNSKILWRNYFFLRQNFSVPLRFHGPQRQNPPSSCGMQFLCSPFDHGSPP